MSKPIIPSNCHDPIGRYTIVPPRSKNNQGSLRAARPSPRTSVSLTELFHVARCAGNFAYCVSLLQSLSPILLFAALDQG